MPAEYPTIADMEARLEEMGITPAADALLTADLTGAIDRWEELTGFAPFLADDANTDWYYQPSGTNLIDFDGGFVEISAVKTSVSYANPSGVVAVLGRDYTPKPDNATSRNKPYTYLKFAFPLASETEATVKVTGKKGYAVSIKQDVWNAILAYALAPTIAQSIIKSSEGAQKVKQDTVEYDFGAKGGTAIMTADDALARMETLAKSYRLLKIA